LRLSPARRRGVLGGLVLLLGLSGCATPSAAPSAEARPAVVGDGWETATLEAVGMDRRPIDAMTDMLRRYPDWNVHAVLIERDGRLVYEEHFAGADERWGRPLGRIVFDRQTKHDLRSVTKSVVSALVGIAHGSGTIDSLDRPIVDFFPELGALATPEWRRVSVRHALMMAAGLEWNESLPYTDPRNDEVGLIRSPDPIRFVLSRAVTTEPGTLWNYNGGLTHLLSAIVQRSTGQPLRDYARAVLFEPLGIDDVDWDGDLGGMPSAASGLRLRPRDLAKFGSLYLHGGRWGGRQVIPADWVSESVRRHIALPAVSAFGIHGYGYQWWHTCYRTAAGTFETHLAVGNGQQRIYVLPQLRLVVTILAGRYNDPTANLLPVRLLVEQIIPAIPARADRTRDSASCAAARQWTRVPAYFGCGVSRR
jgi:CubicO group peptidase (beta-lactamase class C family)